MLVIVFLTGLWKEKNLCLYVIYTTPSALHCCSKINTKIKLFSILCRLFATEHKPPWSWTAVNAWHPMPTTSTSRQRVVRQQLLDYHPHHLPTTTTTLSSTKSNSETSPRTPTCTSAACRRGTARSYRCWRCRAWSSSRGSGDPSGTFCMPTMIRQNLGDRKWWHIR